MGGDLKAWKPGAAGAAAPPPPGRGQGLTLVHFSPQPEPFMTQINSLHTP
jgi:hypothetical protein